MNTLLNNSNEWKEAKGMSALALKVIRSSPAGRVAGYSPNVNITGVSKTSQTPVPQILVSAVVKP